MNALHRWQPHIHTCTDTHPTEEATIPVKFCSLLVFLERKQPKNWYHRPPRNFHKFQCFLQPANLLLSSHACRFAVQRSFSYWLFFPLPILGRERECIQRRTFRKPPAFHVAFQSSEGQTKSSHLVQIGHSSRGIYNLIFWSSDAH